MLVLICEVRSEAEFLVGLIQEFLSQSSMTKIRVSTFPRMARGRSKRGTATALPHRLWVGVLGPGAGVGSAKFRWLDQNGDRLLGIRVPLTNAPCWRGRTITLSGLARKISG